MIKPWLYKDEDFLRKNWGKTPSSHLAKILGRTTNSVEQKARKLGLSASRQIEKERIKEKAKRPATKQERVFWGQLVIRGCQVPGCGKPANIHHEKFLSQGGHHQSVVGLCRFHHQDQKHGRHAMSRARFNETYKMDILKLAADNWERFKKS